MRHRNQDEFTNSKFLKSMRELRSFRQTAVWTTSYDGTTEPEICSEMIRRKCCPGISMISTRFDEFKLQYPRPSAKKSKKKSQAITIRFRSSSQNSCNLEKIWRTRKIARNKYRQIGPKILGAFGIFSADLSAPILVL